MRNKITSGTNWWVVLSFCISIVYFGCTSKKMNFEAFIVNNKCQCDSIFIESNNFIIDDDSLIYSISEKVPFDFKLYVDTGFVLIENRKYYYLMAGFDVDTIGLLNISKDGYIFQKNRYEDAVLLFDFNAKTDSGWMIDKEGYFKNYKIILRKIKYDSYINDSIFCFNLDYKEPKLPNGYYFVNFEVSRYYGIINFSFDNGIDCFYYLPKSRP